jgi:hypothetical protein
MFGKHFIDLGDRKAETDMDAVITAVVATPQLALANLHIHNLVGPVVL